MLEVGKIINTHGLRGEVKVVSWTDVPEAFEYIKNVTTKKGAESINLTVQRIKYQKNILVKTKNNLRQSELTLYERKENVKTA